MCSLFNQMNNDVCEDRLREILITVGHLSKNVMQDSQGNFQLFPGLRSASLDLQFYRFFVSNCQDLSDSLGWKSWDYLFSS